MKIVENYLFGKKKPKISTLKLLEIFDEWDRIKVIQFR